MRDLSVLIPARNEIFLGQTVENILSNIEADTEVIAVLDGYLPDPPIPGNPRFKWIYHEQPIGQRAAVNEAARVSDAKFVMKLDAHCAVDKGFDVKLMADYQRDWTVIPRMYNLHAFDWECPQCGERHYQCGPTVPQCPKCNVPNKMTVVWKPRLHKMTDFARFDNTLHFQYWRKYYKRPEAMGDIVDLFSSVGACFFMSRRRFNRLGGLDEKHGFWGQFGTEVSCKSWLSGGRQVVNKKTWFSHFFRVGGLKFPYHLTGNAQERARQYSRWLWFGNHWEGAKLPLKWLIDKFAPAPSWENFDWEQATKLHGGEYGKSNKQAEEKISKVANGIYEADQQAAQEVGAD